jgi:hypothetical protein
METVSGGGGSHRAPRAPRRHFGFIVAVKLLILYILNTRWIEDESNERCNRNCQRCECECEPHPQPERADRDPVTSLHCGCAPRPSTVASRPVPWCHRCPSPASEFSFYNYMTHHATHTPCAGAARGNRPVLINIMSVVTDMWRHGHGTITVYIYKSRPHGHACGHGQALAPPTPHPSAITATPRAMWLLAVGALGSEETDVCTCHADSRGSTLAPPRGA